MAVLGTNMLLPVLASLGAAQLGFKKQRSPASRMQEKLRPISYSLRDFSRTKVRAFDLEQTLEELEKPKQQLTGRWKKDKELSDPMDEVIMLRVCCTAVGCPVTSVLWPQGAGCVGQPLHTATFGNPARVLLVTD